MDKNEFYISCNQENCWDLIDENYNNENVIRLNQEYERIWGKILRKENFVYTRYGDGEYGLMTGKSISAQEGWTAGEGITKLGQKLLSTLSFNDPRIIYGISCPCCDLSSYIWYLDQIENVNVSFANIWVNANYEKFLKDFCELERDAVLITNSAGKGKTFGKLNVKKHYYVDNQCVKFWEREGEAFIQNIISEVGKQNDLLYVLSAGPLSQIIIAELFRNNPSNCYIDFGSSLDFIIHSKITRPFMIKTHPLHHKNCWMYSKRAMDFDVDVVLTSYKRPETLKMQLNAIKNQSIKPKHIFLYKDGIDSYYQIELKKEILEEFDDVYVSQVNLGVWERFDYAAQVSSSKYVCIFDDDTIPGSRWIENCVMHMQQKTAVYGTNGILLKHDSDYPNEGGWLNVGWHNPNEEPREVDFVGHSWFLQTEWLKYMLAEKKNTEYKYVGEDMGLSFACQKKQIKTFVPPHPYKDPQMWGSLPKYGLKYGTNDVAISVNSCNYTSMNKVFKQMRRDGWKLISDQRLQYITQVEEEQKNEVSQKNNMIKKDLEFFLSEKSNLYIYGAGKYGLLVWKYLKEKNVQVSGFVISKKNSENDVYTEDKLPVFSIEELACHSDKKKILLALNEFYHEEIRNNISDNITVYPKRDCGYDYDDIIRYFSIF